MEARTEILIDASDLTADAASGTRVRVSYRIGYVPTQYRPYPCNSWAPDPNNRGAYSGGCKCGKCDGEARTEAGTLTRVVHWADNSIEAMIELDEPIPGAERNLYIVQLAAPSGDLCF